MPSNHLILGHLYSHKKAHPSQSTEEYFSKKQNFTALHPTPSSGLKQGYVCDVFISAPARLTKEHTHQELSPHVRANTLLRKDIQMSDGMIYTACQ